MKFVATVCSLFVNRFLKTVSPEQFRSAEPYLQALLRGRTRWILHTASTIQPLIEQPDRRIDWQHIRVCIAAIPKNGYKSIGFTSSAFGSFSNFLTT